MFNLNQIVKGNKAGVFVVIGFREIDGEEYAQLKEVNPNNHAQHGNGEFALPLTAIKKL